MTETNDTPEVLVNLLSIDAWRDGPGWQWNNWHGLKKVPVSVCDLKPRKLLKYLRDNGVLSDYSKGKVAVEDDQYNVVIVAKGTREPLYAIAYGEAL